MAELTQKQENFCLAYIETSNASEAYRRSFACSKSKPETINEAACRLLKNSKVAARIAAIRKPAVESAEVTLKQHLDDLKRLRDLAEASEKFGPAVQAEMARGKASGLYVDRTELTGKDGGPVEMVAPKLEIVLHKA